LYTGEGLRKLRFLMTDNNKEALARDDKLRPMGSMAFARMTRRQAVLALGGTMTGLATRASADPLKRVDVRRVPEGGLQPQVALDDRGKLHLAYFAGEPRQGNLLYAVSTDGGRTFSRALPINSEQGSAIATGTIRGAQLALGKSGRIHVAWNGSRSDGPLNPDSGKPGAPMLCARMTDAGNAFEPQRNLMHHSFGLDGGGSLAADPAGNVYVAWHGIGESEASGTGKEGEARRRVWITKSQDEGRSFSTEQKAWPEETGACGCCGMKIYADRRSNVFALYRSATESVHRDIYLLTSKDQGKTFQGRLVHKWEINACPMSSMDFADNGSVVVGAWETGGQVFWVRVDGDMRSTRELVSAPGDGKGRKHPRVAVNQKGEVLLVWTEGTGWQKGGSLAYQLFDKGGKPTPEKGQLPGVAAWSFGAVAAWPDGNFSLLY
jgi:hypothetical protein